MHFWSYQRENSIIIPFTCPDVSTMGSVNSVTGLFTQSQEHLLSVSLFPQLNCSFNSFLPFFFLLSHSVSLLFAFLRRNNSVCSYWNEVQLLSAWANFVFMYKAFHEIFTTLINMKYSSIINVPFHLNFAICHAKTSETIR